MSYTSEDIEITQALEEAKSYGAQNKIKVNVPLPVDSEQNQCDVFWHKVQIWPVMGIDPMRYSENMIPHACRAVVKGHLNSLGYLFDYDNIMDFWNNEKLVTIRQNLMNGIYPDEECKYCYCCRSTDSVFSLKKTWSVSSSKNLEKFKTSKIVQSLSSDSICIDLGANIGDITQVFADKGAEVYSFEPNPAAFTKLQERFALSSKVHLFNKAVASKDGKARLFMYKYNSDDSVFWSQGASLFESKDDIDQNNFVEVEVINILAFLKDLCEKKSSPIDVLKMDIEGAEYEILLNMIELNLCHNIRHILVETHERHIPELIPISEKIRCLINSKKITNINLNWV
jgi:FkbM family methyltransferase